MFALDLLTLQVVLITGMYTVLSYAEKCDDVTKFLGAADEYTIENSPDEVSKNKSANEKPGYLPFLQVDDVDSGLYDHPARLPANSCTRPCVRGDTRTCYYKFYLELYVTMGGACGNCTKNITECYNPQCVTADGYDRSILTINRRMPGPSIQVCEGDKIVVDVHNMMGGRSTTMHWHGLRMKDSKFMDGVPMVTQCPIQEGSTFRYSFKADTWGMHFYHSHDGLQKLDGLVGSLLIRIPKDEDPNKDEYDYELPSHVIVVQDWNHLTADSMFPGFALPGPDHLATSFLIQGRGQFIQDNGKPLANTPLAEFNVTKGKRYLFHLVAGSCFECQYIFTIERHDFLIIAADGQPIKPYRVNSLTMSPGERFRVVVNATRPVGAYWMTVRGVGFCERMNASQVAVLRYNGGPKIPSTPRPNHLESAANKVGLTVNPVNSICTDKTRGQDGPCASDLQSAYSPSNDITKPQPDLRIYWIWSFYVYVRASALYQKGKYNIFQQTPRPQMGSTINGIVSVHSSSPLLSQPDDVPSDLLCSADIANLTNWSMTPRECTHVIKLPVNKVVEIVSIDNFTYRADGISHSIHLHGYDMYMMEMGLLNPNISKNEAIYQLMDYLDSDERREIPSHPVNKDTFPLTAGGYAVSRIYTDNPGYWFFHCHFAYHLDSGMSGILQVGEVNTFPKPPKGFPKCANFEPDDV